MTAIELLDGLWNATLALTVSLLLVAVLRVPWRRALGAEHACRLWWLPPLAVLTGLLPHPQGMPVLVTIPAVLHAAPGLARSAAATSGGGVSWPALLASAWLGGALAFAAWAAWRQWRFARRLDRAKPWPQPGIDVPVWRAADACTGPALVGAWRPRIVVPADFEQRYDDVERTLILAHEVRHAQRRDSLACAGAVAMQAVFWFHPMAWWSMLRFRADQELACDAGVIRHHPRHRRGYAVAMFKTQAAAHALPAGCPWLNSHPVKERIAMLNRPFPTRARRFGGWALVLCLGTATAATAYAAQQSAPKAVSTYQVTLDITSGGKPVASPSVCLRPGQPGSVSETKDNGEPAWTFDLSVTPAMHRMVRVDLHGTMGSGDQAVPVNATIRSTFAKDTTWVTRVPGTAQRAPVRIEVRAVAGCPANPTIRSHMKDVSARRAAQTVADAAGYTLENPQGLDERTVSFHFLDMAPERALQLIATVDGRRAVIKGKRVRFEPEH